MGAWWAKVSAFCGKWRYARYRMSAARADLRDEREAEELERARKGVDRFPPHHGGGF